VAITEGGNRLEFGHLALATGARPRLLAVPGADLAGICYLRDVGHALELRERLAAAQRVLVVGGGFIGLEAAASATAMGKTVTVVEAADRLIGRVVAPVISDVYAAAHRRRGVRVLLGTAVSRFEGTVPAGPGGTVTGAHLSDGGFVPADLVIIGIGAEPRTELAQRLGLACAGGIVVDAFARTSDPAIVAAGDCAVTPHPAAADDSLVRLESYGHAIDHAKVAAATLAGMPARYDAVPWFWSDQGTLKLQIAGLSGGFDQAVLRGDPGQERFAVLYYHGGRLLAVHAVNSPRDYLAVRRALAAGQEIPADLAADPDRPLKPASDDRGGQPPVPTAQAGV
jgi:3-phenylpropionate/trans-cinnamate dioxygenase ferredoxin reductase subunit